MSKTRGAVGFQQQNQQSAQKLFDTLFGHNVVEITGLNDGLLKLKTPNIDNVRNTLADKVGLKTDILHAVPTDGKKVEV